jgi:hypothetical protein
MSWSEEMRVARLARGGQMDWIDHPALAYKLVCDAGTVLANAMVKARRAHGCTICERAIIKGERVRREARRDTAGALVSLSVGSSCCGVLQEGDTNHIDILYRSTLRMRNQAARPSAGPAGGQPPAGGETGREAQQ